MSCACPRRKPKVGEMFHVGREGSYSLWLVLRYTDDGRCHAAVRYQNGVWHRDTATNGDAKYHIIEGENHGHSFYN